MRPMLRVPVLVTWRGVCVKKMDDKNWDAPSKVCSELLRGARAARGMLEILDPTSHHRVSDCVSRRDLLSDAVSPGPLQRRRRRHVEDGATAPP